MVRRPLASVRDAALDESLRLATAAGVVVLPAVATLAWLSFPNVALGGPVLVAGITIGYLYRDRSPSSGRAGTRTGLAVAIPITIWFTLGGAVQWMSSSIGPGIGFALIVVGVALNLLYYAGVGFLSGIIGHRLAEVAAPSTR